MTNTEKCMGKEDLFAYANHLLETEAERGVRAHLGGCAACRAMVAEYQTLDALLDEWKPASPSAWFDARVRAAVAAQPRRFAFFGFRWAQVMAMACVVLMVTAASLMISRRSVQLERNEQAAANITAKAKVEEELTLYKDLPVLEDQDYDMLANFDVLSAVPRGDDGDNKVEN